MARALILTILVAAFSGCQHTQLRKSTAWQAETVTDLNYQQVQANLLILSEKPGSLPFFALAGTGLTNVRRDLTGTANVGWTLFGAGGLAFNWFFDRVLLIPSCTNSTVEQWTSMTVLTPEQLEMMARAYRRTLGVSTCEDDLILHYFFLGQPEIWEAMRPGWFCIGKFCDVPKNAAAVTRCGCSYIWVMPEHLPMLSRLTVGILDIATAPAEEIQQRSVPPEKQAERQRFQRAARLAEILKNLPPAEVAKPEYDSVRAFIHETLSKSLPSSRETFGTAGQTTESRSVPIRERMVPFNPYIVPIDR